MRFLESIQLTSKRGDTILNQWESKFAGYDIPQWRMVRTGHTVLRLQKT